MLSGPVTDLRWTVEIRTQYILAAMLTAVALTISAEGAEVPPNTGPSVNDRIRLEQLRAPSQASVPDGGLYVIRARFRNSSSQPIHDLCFQVRELSGGAVQLENANLIPPGLAGPVGSSVCVGELSPGQATDVQFDIRKDSKGDFRFFVDAFDRAP